jgi:hypothetical protein
VLRARRPGRVNRTSIPGPSRSPARNQTLDADFVFDPQLINTARYALPAACEIWKLAHGNALLPLPRAIQGATSGIISRQNWLARTRDMWPQEH